MHSTAFATQVAGAFLFNKIIFNIHQPYSSSKSFIIVKVANF